MKHLVLAAAALVVATTASAQVAGSSRAIIFAMTSSCDQALPILAGGKINPFGSPQDEIVSVALSFYMIGMAEGLSGTTGPRSFDPFRSRFEDICGAHSNKTIAQVVADLRAPNPGNTHDNN